MSLHDTKKGYILIADDIRKEYERLKEELKPNRVVGFIEDEFKLEHAKAAVAEAYISESDTKYIVLGADTFNIFSQNSLLKVLEEPPSNIEFIIISSTKSNLLPTIRSRMPILKGEKKHQIQNIDFSLGRLDYAEVFAFLKANARIKKSEAKELVEAIFYKAVLEENLHLSESVLKNFDNAYRLLELNSRPQSVLAMLIMSFAGEKNAS